MTTEAEIAWAAGLFEGEGSIIASKRSANYTQGRLEMRITDEDVIRRFCKVVGRGKVQSKDYDQAWNSIKRVYVWKVTDVESVRHVLNMLMPYLGRRRRAKARELLKVTRKSISIKAVVR